VFWLHSAFHQYRLEGQVFCFFGALSFAFNNVALVGVKYDSMSFLEQPFGTTPADSKVHFKTTGLKSETFPTAWWHTVSPYPHPTGRKNHSAGDNQQCTIKQLRWQIPICLQSDL
jgi:hypothetical protein